MISSDYMHSYFKVKIISDIGTMEETPNDFNYVAIFSRRSTPQGVGLCFCVCLCVTFCVSVTKTINGKFSWNDSSGIKVMETKVDQRTTE